MAEDTKKLENLEEESSESDETSGQGDLPEESSESEAASEIAEGDLVEETSPGQEEAVKDQSQGLDRILSMKVPVIVKVAEKKMALQNIMKINMGSVIQFDKDAYQLIDLMVNNSTIGLGKPIKIGENFGLKITQIGDIARMIQSLGPDEQKSD